MFKGSKNSILNTKENKNYYIHNNDLHINTEINARTESFKIAIIYAIIGLLWIILSDEIVNIIVKDKVTFKRVETYKGLVYVIITAVIIYILTNKKISKLKHITNRLIQSYQELESTHEELIAIQDELNDKVEELNKNRKVLKISKQKYELAVDGANDGIWDWDIVNDELFLSSRWKSMLGYRNNEIPNENEVWDKLLHPDDVNKAKQEMEDYIEGKKSTYRNIFRLRCKNGKYKWILSRGKGIFDKKGKLIRVAGSHTDITKQKELEESLRKERDFSNKILDNSKIIVLVWKLDGTIIKFNKYGEEITGFKEREIIGKSWLDVLIPQEIYVEMEKNVERFKRGEALQDHEHPLLCKNGDKIDVLWDNSFIQDKKSDDVTVVSTGINITNRKKYEKKIYSLAYYDSLTNLPNRAMFEEKLKSKINIAKEEKSKFALLYLDLDNFKKVNDTLGHDFGDELLIKISNEIRDTVNKDETFFRVGGDEFVLIKDNICNDQDIENTIKKVMDIIKKPWMLAEREFYITTSIGIAIYPDNGLDMNTLFKNADLAMYESKESGKDCYYFYNSYMKDKTLIYLNTENELRRAIEKEQFVLYYQPQINLESEQIVGLEALIRWEHPQKGIISPINFIPIAEKTELIVDIGKWVMRQACIDMKKWHESGYCSIDVSVNLSTKQFLEEDLLQEVELILAETRVNSRHLIFEITENTAIHDVKRTINILNKLREKNIKIALDDFGTGYSSLSYLKRLPIDILKLDKMFINNIDKDIRESAISKSIIRLAREIDMDVVAEGIETIKQLNVLKEYSCNNGQGYLFYKPLPMEEATKKLKRCKI